MERKPTIFGGGASAPIATTSPVVNAPAILEPMPRAASTIELDNFPVTIAPERLVLVTDRLEEMDFLTMSAQDMALIGANVERMFTDTLNGFLKGMDRLQNHGLFALFERLQQGVDEQNLPAVAEQILNNKRGVFSILMDKFRSRKGRSEAMQRARDQVTHLLQGVTETLVDLMNDMDADMGKEQCRLKNAVDDMDSLTRAYRHHFDNFAMEAAVAHAFLIRARTQVEAIANATDLNNPVQVGNLEDLRSKLQALESRSLALEGTMTRIPADQLVTRQLKAAGIDTLREVATTATMRMQSIKMTLITLGQALVMKGVQDLAAQGATLDAQLTKIRSQVVRGVVVTAANAPGDNRIAQAKQIEGVIAETRDLMNIVNAAREANRQKFDTARQIFAGARKSMLDLVQQGSL